MPRRPPKIRQVSVLLHVVFFLSGIATVLIGQVLPILIRRFSLSDLEAGYLFPAQILVGALTGNLLSIYIGRRGGYIWATVIGCFLMTGGLLLMNSADYWTCVAGFIVNGLGTGLTLPAINLLVLEMTTGNTAAALSILNFCWGAGAIVSKPFVDYFGTSGSIFIPTALLAAAMAAGGLATLISAPQWARITTAVDSGPEPDTQIWRTRVAWAIAIFNFVHVGFESGIGGWMTTFSDRLDPSSAPLLISPTLLYFGFFVLGRGVLPAMFKFVSENAVFLANLALMLCGLIVSLTATSIVQAGVGAAIAGLGTSVIFPMNVARFGRIFGAEASRRAAPFFIAGTLGSAILSWLIGFISERMGSLRLGMLTLIASVVVLLVLQVGLMRGRPVVKAEVP
ncbi:MAG TPA: MFS transporter [Pyrinomonadaceae bacterium]